MYQALINPVPAAAECPAPLAVARALSRRPGLVFLDSATPGPGRISIVAVEPVEVIEGCIFRDGDRLRKALRDHERREPGDLGGPAGGLFGSIGFEGRFVFGVYLRCLVYCHGAQSWRGTPGAAPGWDGMARIEHLPRGRGEPDQAIQFAPRMDRDEFEQMVRRAQEYIAAGDIYQVNLSYPWEGAWPGGLEPFEFYERLRAASPAPHSACLDLAGTQVFSASPECFLKMSGRRIVTRPIKGTRPRGRDLDEDARLASELRRSAKERAELVMITDLERNDLGQVCEFGSVRVTGLLGLERHAQVHHLASTIEGRLREDVDHVGALAACFPGGSISGAPKKRALEIIRELEPHPRGLYTGAIGYFGFNGESQFSIAIRTAWRAGGVVRFHAGAGIVADSVPAQEFEETRHKAAGILLAAQAPPAPQPAA